MNMEENHTHQEQDPGKRTRIVLEWVEDLVVAVVLIAVIFTFLFRVITVTGTSMAPNYNDGDRVLVVNAFSDAKPGDVVVITNVLSEPIIKRVIATQGQTVGFDVETKSVLINGQPIDETEFGLKNGITELPYSSLQVLEFPTVVPAGCVFVLGDNRGVSEDSRYKVVGMIDERNILGKAIFKIFPFK